MKKLISSLFFIFALSIQFSFAGGGSEKAAAIRKTRMIAEYFFENHQYEQALRLYLQLENKTIDKGVISYMIGMCYLTSPEKDKALHYLIEAKESRQTSFVINYYLGRVYYESGQYVKALNYLSQYLKELNSIDDLQFKPFKDVPQEHLIHYQKSARDVNRIMDECRFALRSLD